MKTAPNRRFTEGECCVRSPDGTVSDRSLHEQIMGGVDDSEFRALSRKRMLEKGLTPQQIDRLYLDLPSGSSESEPVEP
jgi:hypothetical protein